MAEDVKHPHHCGKCTKRWGGLNTSHCGACHTTFTGLTAFEKHRHKGTCLTPEAAGLALTGREYECYGAPITNDRWRPDALQAQVRPQGSEVHDHRPRRA